MSSRFSLWMRLQEMVEDVQQGQDVLLIAASLGSPNIIDNHVPDFVAAVLLGRKVLSERGRSNFGKMFVLCNGEHLLFGQATPCNAIFQRDHFAMSGSGSLASTQDPH